MEEILREMQRHGWRHPRQGEPLDPQASLGAEGIGPVEPDGVVDATWGQIESDHLGLRPAHSQPTHAVAQPATDI
jgi:hypothetical protein